MSINKTIQAEYNEMTKEQREREIRILKREMLPVENKVKMFKSCLEYLEYLKNNKEIL